MPDINASVSEAVWALDDLHTDGVVLLANSKGSYIGEVGQEDLFNVLDDPPVTKPPRICWAQQ